MPRRVLSSRPLPNALLLVLTLGGLTLGGCAYDRSAQSTGYAWNYVEDAGDGAKLAYGRPNSDDVVMMMACAPGASAVTLTATGLSGDQIALASGHRVTHLKAQPLASDMSDGVLEARTSVDASALSAFRRIGALDLLVTGERHALNAAPADHRDVRAFFKACSARSSTFN